VQVDLTPLAPRLQHAADMEDLVAALHKAVQDKQRSVPISQLALRNCSAVNDNVVNLLLDSLPTLRAADFARCEAISDGALRRLSRHVAETPDAAEVLGRLETMSIGASQVCLPCRSCREYHCNPCCRASIDANRLATLQSSRKYVCACALCT
jgi:hypothetical protein